MFTTIKKCVRRFSAVVISAHMVLAGMAPLLHAHSATPLSIAHPEQIHFHLWSPVAEVGICSLTGNERHIYTAETSESRQSDDVLAKVSDLKVLLAYPTVAKTERDGSKSPGTKAPRDPIEISPQNLDAQLGSTNPQAP